MPEDPEARLSALCELLETSFHLLACRAVLHHRVWFPVVGVCWLVSSCTNLRIPKTPGATKGPITLSRKQAHRCHHSGHCGSRIVITASGMQEHTPLLTSFIGKGAHDSRFFFPPSSCSVRLPPRVARKCSPRLEANKIESTKRWLSLVMFPSPLLCSGTSTTRNSLLLCLTDVLL